MQLAERIAAGARGSLGATKRLLRDSLSCSLSAQLEAELNTFAELSARAEFQEGLDAFHEKRPPRFRT